MASLRYRAPAWTASRLLRRPSFRNRLPSIRLIMPTCHVLPANLHCRFTQESRLQVKQRWVPLLASNTNPSGESDESDDDKTSGSAQGPPFLTILAGFLVLLLIFWIIGSIVMWLIGLIIHPPPLK